MKTMAWLAVLGVGVALTTAGVSATEVAGCEGTRPLYAFPSDQEASEGKASKPGRGPALPLAFLPSGDACLGPVPVFGLVLQGVEPGREAPSTHAMARYLAPGLQEYSQRTGLEGCARMCTTSGGTVVAQAVTVNSHVSCAAPPQTCPAGSVPTAETIHSHPPHRVFLGNAVDGLGWNESGVVGQWVLTGYPNAVSDIDRTQAPVWVVGTEGQLMWLATPEGQEVVRP